MFVVGVLGFTGVLSRASCRRHPLSGQKTFTVLSLHINNIYAKKRGIGKKLILTIRAVMFVEKVDLVLHGGATTGTTSVPSKKPLPTAPCRCLPAPHHCGDPDRSRATGLTFVGSLNLLNPIGTGKYGFRGAFSIPHEIVGLRLNDHSCHHEAWLHLDFRREA